MENPPDMVNRNIFALIQTALNMFYLFFFNEALSDDSEDEAELIDLHIRRLQKRVTGERNKPSRIKLFLEETILQSSSKEFQSHFRVTIDAFEWLLGRIGPQLQNRNVTGRNSIVPKKQLLSVLWLLATPDSYRSVGNRFDMGKSSLFECFERVIKALNSLAPEIIMWPQGIRTRTIKNGFAQMAGIQGVKGAIDGTYIPIKAPPINPQVYVNRKCFHGITLQVVCDHDRRIIDAFTGYPSSVSDIRIFRNSDLYRQISQNPQNYFEENTFIIGDKAYPNNNWCIPPYIDRGNLLLWQQLFNRLHAQTRQVIERTFALLFGRMRRLRYLDMNRIDLIPATIIAACVIHNVCLNFYDEDLENYQQQGHNFVYGDDEINRDHNNIENNANDLRDRLAEELFVNNNNDN